RAVQPGAAGLHHLRHERRSPRPGAQVLQRAAPARPVGLRHRREAVITKRTGINVVVFFLLSSLLIYLGMTKFILSSAGKRTVNVVFSNAQGLLPRDDVTVRGVPS